MQRPGGTLRGSALDLVPMVSYAGNHEDVRLRRIVGLLPSTTYVDVGAGDPVIGSVTYWLYTQGWRGVLVEPGERAEKLSEVRPGDIVLSAAVGSGPGEAVLYETSPDPGMSTMRADRLPELLSLGQSVHERRIPMLSLTEVFEQAPGPVSILSVDVEGAEDQVLGSLDWSAHRPVVVVVEAILPWQAVSTREDFEQRLLTADYVEAAFDGVNLYYVDARAEHREEITAALSYPLCVLDRWEPAVVPELRAAADRGEETAKALATVRGELAAAQEQVADRDRRISRLARLESSHAELEDRLVRLQSGNDALRAQLDDQQQRYEEALAHLTRSLETTTAELQAVLSSTTWRLASPVAHALAPRAKALRVPRNAGSATAQLRARAVERVAQIRLRRAGPEGRAVAALVRSTHPDFLARDADTPSVVRAPDGRTWSEVAREGAADDDNALRRRLDARSGVRDDLQRAVQVAALAEAVADRGKTRTPRRHAERELTVLDARSLQDVGLATRGVGQFARELVRALREAPGELVLLVDPRLPPLPDDIGGLPTAEHVGAAMARRARWLVQPSPMTADAWPFAVLLDDDQVWCTTVVHDFIPWRFPGCYLPGEGALLQQAARQQALRLYDEVWANSHTTLADVARVVTAPTASNVVWPAPEDVRDPLELSAAPLSLPGRFVLVVAGNEHRKNLVGALAACALHRSHDPATAVVVMGWSGPEEQVHSWADEVGLPRDSVRVLPYLPEDQVRTVRRAALAAVIPSFAEGLSLPVPECVRDGCPVVISAIPPHLELIGPGAWAADPADPAALASALRAVLAAGDSIADQQRARLDRHEHTTVAAAVAARSAALEAAPSGAAASSSRSSTPPSLGIVTPWPPQRSGIADYSQATLAPLADRVSLTLYLSATAQPPADLPHRPAQVGLAAPNDHDVLLTVLGNSHFHLPGLEMLETYGGVALCHDVRMTELNHYLGLGDPPVLGGGAAGARRTLRHELDALPSVGYAHVAKHSDLLLFHSAATALRVGRETGARTASLPFVPYRVPSEPELAQRESARERLGLEDDLVHLGVLGGVDIRTKAADVLLEAQAWLRQWGHPVVMHVVGGIEPSEQDLLQRLAEEAGVAAHVRWHGHVGERRYRDFLLAVDVAAQLRTAALLSLSGAAADLAAYGVPTVATSAMISDMGLPAFVRALPDDFSPLLLAEALERAWQERPVPAELEVQRMDYLLTHSREEYADRLLALLELEL